ncbi:MAG TPA: orotidine-5'-phosphate decarboxylase [Kofleriaceae bacterium]|nr:orotidine-5'-phosphate decarboxylase [Kofleriaceae bacterium]
MTFEVGNRLIAALDVDDRAKADALAATLGDAASFVKIGLELFCATGPAIVRDYASARRRVMLDLKLHDIPETVARATAQVDALGAELLTVHASGGRAMLEAAARAAKRTRILAVTVLTSLGDADLDAIGVRDRAAAQVVRLATLAKESGCAGVVASPHEARAIRDALGAGFLIVTPGVRPAGADAGDQKRVTTPKMARDAGADLVVVGRPIRDAHDPAAAARAIASELA